MASVMGIGAKLRDSMSNKTQSILKDTISEYTNYFNEGGRVSVVSNKPLKDLAD